MNGRLVAMAAGVKFRRKPHLKSDSVMTLIYQKQSVRLVIEKTGIFRATYFRLKKVLLSLQRLLPNTEA